MTKNSSREQGVKDKLKVKRDETNVDYNILLKKYFIDEFLRLLSKSTYRTKFIWKGGFVLSAITGVEKRTTVDLDTMLQGVTVDKASLTDIVNQIIGLSDPVGCQYVLKSIEPIQEKNAYQGLRIDLQGKLGQMQDNFHLDIATGEKLIPSAMSWNYQPLIGNKIGISIYRPERILAEKIQTILTRSIANTRMKDFFDIYLISHLAIAIEIEPALLAEAIQAVMLERGTADLLVEWRMILDIIAQDSLMHRRWIDYRTKHDFVKAVTFAETIEATKDCLQKIVIEDN
ncbi:nucleotidyl transferase AbiEii/AbiGii toxin family protein [Lactiplantibacillus sp. WILCCON 0030]|uniref:Nucleotidyl transferase AbiEii/AbiGii toxin family protein n=1 Tax=Lactiplantibacillus brownii TaxID=3069269 RepID=A0ABU1AA63_9LACO|nr:nucleotidyl transferase AbiEii/AbiGii toxin family protein [Lactiplantibacillus brownii]MDQ7937824.1 nucleotidyl transferase AbiEii/AbiGii toxin family protein [Lactiplantibacillus brownii]